MKPLWLSTKEIVEQYDITKDSLHVVLYSYRKANRKADPEWFQKGNPSRININHFVNIAERKKEAYDNITKPTGTYFTITALYEVVPNHMAIELAEITGRKYTSWSTYLITNLWTCDAASGKIKMTLEDDPDTMLFQLERYCDGKVEELELDFGKKNFDDLEETLG